MAPTSIQSIGPYQIVEVLGEGGMAVVYKAVDTRLSRFVAIKMIRQAAMQDNATLQRFDREAKTLAQLNHPNIAKILDYGTYQGSPYLVMEYMSGGTYRQKAAGPMDYRKAARALLPIARALYYAHQKGVIHRDIKPANILIDENGEPKLSDFGIAKALTAGQHTELTATGSLIGTPAYMAPEQFLGDKIDQRCDIYSLGVVFFEMITGNRPFQADTPAGVIARQATQPVPLASTLTPGLPPNVDQVLLKAMAKQTEERFQSMNDFIGALEWLAAGTPAAGKPTFIKPAAPVTAQPGTMTQARTLTSTGMPPQAPSTAWSAARKPRINLALLIAGLIAAFLVVGLAAGIFILWQAGAAISKASTEQALLTSATTPEPSPQATVVAETTKVAETTVVALATGTLASTRLPDTPTPTLKAASPTPAEPGLIFFDAFADRGSGWAVFQDASGKADYVDGRFNILVSEPQLDLWSNPGLSNLQDVQVSVEAQQAGSVDNNIYGVICRSTRDMGGVNFYFFGISGLGTAAIGKTVANEQVYLQRISEPSAAINTGQTGNKIVAICSKNTLKLLVNGVEVLSATDNSLASGDVGLLAGTFSEPGTDIRFDNFKVSVP